MATIFNSGTLFPLIINTEPFYDEGLYMKKVLLEDVEVSEISYGKGVGLFFLFGEDVQLRRTTITGVGTYRVLDHSSLSKIKDRHDYVYLNGL